MRSRVRREVLSSGDNSGPGSPKVRTAPRGTYALVGPRLGRSETFWGPAEECGSAPWPAMIRRAAAGGRGLQLPSCSAGPMPTSPVGPHRTGRTAILRLLRRAEVCNYPWEHGATGSRLRLAVPAGSCVRRSPMWHLESSVVPVQLLRT